MAYTPPARNAIKLVVGGDYTPPERDAINLQLGDDPLMRPTASPGSAGLSSLSISWNNALAYNPQADKVVLYKYDGLTWDVIDTKPITESGTFTISDLDEGTNHIFIVRVITELSPANKVSPDSNEVDMWTDFLVEITSCKDSLGNNLSGAVVVALPEDELLDLVEASLTGVDIPSLSYRKVNKTDSDGTCNIRIPGGKGRVWVLMIPASTSVGGHAIAHLGTEVTEEE
ncbi:MAG: fibronectin type III domain-containing protein [Candidatus Thermoplasmatota archaeon]|nr:fibronectin type III domain-containing protein [Candidatus Thermoplasmatota archaeon]